MSCFHAICRRSLPALLSLAAGSALAQPFVQHRLLKDIGTHSAQLGSNPRNFVSSGGKLYFTATTPATGAELFVSDGESAQAQLVADLAPNGASSDAQLLGSVGSTLIVSGDVGNADLYMAPPQVYALNPASGSIVQLTQFQPTYQDPSWTLSRVTEFNGRVVFRNDVDRTLWATDGSVAGTQRIHAPPTSLPIQPENVCTLDDSIVFSSLSATNVLQLWRSNGTAAGTAKLAEFVGLDSYASAVRDGSSCFFVVRRSTNEHWVVLRSDGTSAGSGYVTETAPFALSGFTAAGGVVFLLEWEYYPGMRLRRSDQAEPIWSSSGRGYGRLRKAAGRLVFTAPAPEGDEHVFVSDGTSAGTRQVLHDGQPLRLRYFSRFVSLGDAVIDIDGDTVMRIDPLAATATKHISPFDLDYYGYAGATVLNGALFVSLNGVDGAEPFRIDGTAAGTRELSNIAYANAPGVSNSYLGGPYLAHQGKLLFRGSGGLWRSDGSEAGTRLVPAERYGSSSIMALLPFGDDILLATYGSGPDPLPSVYRTDMTVDSAERLWSGQPGFNFRYQASGRSVVFGCNVQDEQYCAFRDGELQPAVVIAQPGRVTYLGAAGDAVLFFNNADLWRSDGTFPGTFALLAGPFNNLSAAVAQTPDRLWMEGCDHDMGGCRLLLSDGTVAGSRVVTQTGGRIYHLSPFGDGAIYLAGGGQSELWRSDGSAAGTARIAALGAYVYGLGVVGDRIHMLANYEQPTPARYIVSDGTAAGTRDVPWVPGVRGGEGSPMALDAHTAVFVCMGNTIGKELCAVDGRGQQMGVVGDFYQGPQSSEPTFVGQTGGATYFSLDDGRRGRELWRFTGDRIFTDAFH